MSVLSSNQMAASGLTENRSSRKERMPMRSEFSRREFIAGLGVLAAANSTLSAASFQSSSPSGSSRLARSPFKIAVINDEISQDFGHACEVASQQFGMEWR